MGSADAVITPLRGKQRLLFLLGLVLLWPALMLGDVYAFNDTVSYLRGTDKLAAMVLGHGDPFFVAPVVGASADSQAGPGLVLYGRSLYFGLFLYLGLLAKSFWPIVMLQSLAAGATIVGIVRHFVDPARERRFLVANLAAFALASFTTLPFFVCFLMPDLAVGLALPAAAILLCRWRVERGAWRLGWLALLAFATLAHSSAVAVLGLMAAAALVMAGWRRDRALALAGAAVLACALVGVAGEAAFGLATRLTTGSNPVRPPFLTARLIEDGPGRRYLAEHCAGSDFVLCRHRVLEPVSAEVFLWEPTRPRGGFKALPNADAVQVSREQGRFALAVASTYPGATAVALLRDFAVLATNTKLTDFRPEYRAGLMRADRPFTAMPPGKPLPLVARIVSVLTLALSGMAVVALIGVRGGGTAMMVWTVLAAVVLNDVLCAWLSGPFARYNSRVIWALPLMVGLFYLGRQFNSMATTSRDR